MQRGDAEAIASYGYFVELNRYGLCYGCVMAQRGRKPVDLWHLDQLDGTCYRGFHRLCKGVHLPVSAAEARRMLDGERVEEEMQQAIHDETERQTLEEFWFEAAPPEWHSDLQRAAEHRANYLATKKVWVRQSQERQRDLLSLIEEFEQPKNRKARLASFQVWQALWQADSGVAVSKACAAWDKLTARYRDPLVSETVAKNNEEFVRMKDDLRFPRSRWADEARISYLARGTAGLMMGISPLTAIERLRKVTHKRGHPLFVKNRPGDVLVQAGLSNPAKKARCHCWRCLFESKRERGAAIPYFTEV